MSKLEERIAVALRDATEEELAGVALGLRETACSAWQAVSAIEAGRRVPQGMDLAERLVTLCTRLADALHPSH